MPTAKIRNLNINYAVIGNRGPWVTLITGGRRGHDEFIPLANRLAKEGYQVLLHDRRNTGASDMLIEGDEGEEPIWTDDLAILLKLVGADRAFIGGSSAGARTSILFYLRHQHMTRGLLLFRVTGGPFAAGRLPENYYGQYIRAAQEGGMKAVCATEQYQERIKANPRTGEYLMKLDPKRYIAVMTHWLELFKAGANLPVMGVTEAQLKSIKVPTIVIPGNDNTHSSVSGRIAHEMIPGSFIHQLPIKDEDRPLIPYTEWEPLEDEITRVFVAHMRKAGA